MRAFRTPVILIALMGLLAGCDPEHPEDRAVPVGVSEWLPIALGEVYLEVQVPLTRSEQSRGLMHRESLAENRGMLFAYSAPQQMSFWMKDTLIPLDIGFFDREGVLREIHALYPRDTRTVRSRRQDLHYALEVNQGWFRRNEIRPGARLDRKLLAEALRARGANPEAFGL